MNANTTTPANVNKIQDFGEKIGGARKDYAQQAADLAATLSGLTPEKLKGLSLSKAVKFDQIQRLAVSGAISAPAVCAAFALWRTIPTRPATSWKVGRWAEKTAAVLAEISAIIGGAEITESVKKLPEFRVLEAAGYPAASFAFGKYKVSYYLGTDSPLCVVGGHYYKLRTYSPAECAQYIRTAVAADAEKRAEGATFELYRDGGTYYAAPKGRNKIRVKEWATYDEARAGMQDVEELRGLWDAIRNTPALRRTTNRPRVGVDRRDNTDVTPETFAAAFPFRGVEFGNWLTQADRVTRLNETFDALHDLCALCGLTADAATLKGWLAMAFGSRGIPGAAAHFESGHRVINLTKEHGAGSLAHEWFHALDAFTAARFGAGAFAVEDYGKLPEGELREAAKALYSGLAKSPFARRSEDLDYLKNKTYYGTTREAAARAFEVYVIELAKAQGWQVDFLANVTTAEEWEAAYGNLKGYPYPTAEELAELAPLFARFLSAAADAEELSQDTAALFAEGRAKMEAQREKAAELAAQAAQEKAALREKAAADRLADMERKAAEVLAECSGTWSHAFMSGSYAYGIGGGAGFVFVVWPNGKHGFRVLAQNNRIRKAVRPAHQYLLEVRPGVNVEEVIRAESVKGMCEASALLDVYRHTYAGTWADFSAAHAGELAKAADLFAVDAKKAEKTAAQTAEKTEADQTSTRRKKSRQSEENGAKADESAPAPGLSLVELPGGGVAVVGENWKDTYYHKREIKAHGCTWNKEAKQWQATDPEAVAAVREWFGQEAGNVGEDAATVGTSQNAAGDAVKAAASVAPCAAPAPAAVAAERPALPEAVKICEVGAAAHVDAATDAAQTYATGTTATGEAAPSPTPSALPDEPGTDADASRYSASAKSPKFDDVDRAIAEEFGYTLEIAREHYEQHYTQFHELKKTHPDTLLLFRVGVNYELYGRDAREAAPLLHLACIAPHDISGPDVDALGFSHAFYLLPVMRDQLSHFVSLLCRTGHRIAFCE